MSHKIHKISKVMKKVTTFVDFLTIIILLLIHSSSGIKTASKGAAIHQVSVSTHKLYI